MIEKSFHFCVFLILNNISSTTPFGNIFFLTNNFILLSSLYFLFLFNNNQSHWIGVNGMFAQHRVEYQLGLDYVQLILGTNAFK